MAKGGRRKRPTFDHHVFGGRHGEKNLAGLYSQKRRAEATNARTNIDKLQWKKPKIAFFYLLIHRLVLSKIL